MEAFLYLKRVHQLRTIALKFLLLSRVWNKTFQTFKCCSISARQELNAPHLAQHFSCLMTTCRVFFTAQLMGWTRDKAGCKTEARGLLQQPQPGKNQGWPHFNFSLVSPPCSKNFVASFNSCCCSHAWQDMISLCQPFCSNDICSQRIFGPSQNNSLANRNWEKVWFNLVTDTSRGHSHRVHRWGAAAQSFGGQKAKALPSFSAVNDPAPKAAFSPEVFNTWV